MISKIRIAVFGSFYRGYYLLDELLNGVHCSQFEVVGVATDDVSQSFISKEKRIWQYPHEKWEESMVAGLAESRSLPLYKGRVASQEFFEIFRNGWCPDVAMSATFGQLIPQALFGYPRHGFYNLHPCVNDGWPSKYAGPNPFHFLLQDGHDHAVGAFHRVDAGFDTGELISLSPRIALPVQMSLVDRHKVTSPVFAKFAVSEILRLTGRSVP